MASKQIKIGSFNLFQYVAPPFSFYTKKEKFDKTQWEEKQDWIKKQIQNMDCDIIGFQEVFSQKELKKLCEDLGFKYFVSVDTPKINKQNPNVYMTTTVALASKHEILEVQKVNPHIKSLGKHMFKGYFEFSRKPIKALIKVNNINMTIYVNHFKSNRLNEFEYIFQKNSTLKEKKEKVKKALEKNYSPALKQRLCETSSLYHDIKRCETPTVLICDLNDKEFSLSIDALTNRAYHENMKANSFLLYDSYYINTQKEKNPHPEKVKQRIPTSYYTGKGNVLDYIFVSKHFNNKLKGNIAKVTSYEVIDEHLQKNPNGSLLQSDHAQIVCEIEFL